MKTKYNYHLIVYLLKKVHKQNIIVWTLKQTIITKDNT